MRDDREMWVNHEHVRSVREARFANSPRPRLLPVTAELASPGRVLSRQWLHRRPGQRHTTDDMGPLEQFLLLQTGWGRTDLGQGWEPGDAPSMGKSQGPRGAGSGMEPTLCLTTSGLRTHLPQA